MNLIVLGGSCLVNHDTTKFMFILALQRLDYFVGLIWLKIHCQVIDDVGVWCRRETEVDFGLWIV